MSAPTASSSSSTRQTSDRRRHDESGGTTNNNLNPRRIQTGLPGIRRTVYDGALRVNSDAYDVLSLTVRDVHSNTTAALNNNHNDGDDNKMSLQAKPEWRKHFPLNALLRPSINSTSHNAFHIPSNNNKRRDTILITELTNQTVVTHQPRIVNAATGERAMCAVEGVVTVPRNLEVAVLDAGLMEEEENGQDGAGSEGEAVVNIRGGGDGDDVVMEESKKDDVDMSEAPVSAAIEGGTAAGGGVDNNAAVASSNTASTTPAASAVGGGSNAAVEAKPDEAGAPVPSAQSGVEIKVATQEQQPTAAAVAAATTATTTDAQSQVVSSTDVVGQQGGVADVAKSSNTTQVATSTAVAAASAPAATAPTAAAATSSSGVATTTTATTTTPTTNQPIATSAAPVPKPEATTVKSTTIHPLPQNHPPLSTSIILPTTTTINTPPQNAPSWYHPTTISTTEKSSLPEWFNSSAPHRTPVTYLSTRNQILNIYQAQLSSSNTTTAAASTTTNTTATSGGTTTVQHQQQYLTPTAIRRCVPGDVGSLLRLHSFLCDWGLINGKDLGENAPSDLTLRGGNSGSKGKRKLEDVKRSMFWSKERLEELDGVVVKYVKVTQTTVSGGGGVVEGVPQQQQQQQQPSVDWDAVAKDIGDGVSAADCQRAFLDPPPNDEVSVKIAKTSSSSTSGFHLTTILDGVHPNVLQATINASLKATNDMTEARKASIAGILASTAATKAHSEEEEIARTLMDILDQRMQRLENRVAILDDVEALLEAERVALELERRDMYTTRCRHWFGDGSS